MNTYIWIKWKRRKLHLIRCAKIKISTRTSKTEKRKYDTSNAPVPWFLYLLIPLNKLSRLFAQRRGEGKFPLALVRTRGDLQLSSALLSDVRVCLPSLLSCPLKFWLLRTHTALLSLPRVPFHVPPQPASQRRAVHFPMEGNHRKKFACFQLRTRGVACVIQGGGPKPPPLADFGPGGPPPLARRKNERGDPFLMKNWWKTLSKFKIFGASRHFQKGPPYLFRFSTQKIFQNFLQKGPPYLKKFLKSRPPPLADFVRYAPASHPRTQASEASAVWGGAKMGVQGAQPPENFCI